MNDEVERMLQFIREHTDGNSMKEAMAASYVLGLFDSERIQGEAAEKGEATA